MNILNVPTERRRIADFGEDAAAKLLTERGYKILARNRVESAGEIDIIAKDLEYIVFVEVKTRSRDRDNPYESRAAASITPSKQRRLIAAASSYLAFNPTRLRVRFDVVEVYYTGKDEKISVSEINHLEGAFNKNTAYTKGYRR